MQCGLSIFFINKIKFVRRNKKKKCSERTLQKEGKNNLPLGINNNRSLALIEILSTSTANNNSNKAIQIDLSTHEKIKSEIVG
jgi:hypothetical protein